MFNLSLVRFILSWKLTAFYCHASTFAELFQQFTVRLTTAGLACVYKHHHVVTIQPQNENQPPPTSTFP